MRIQDAHQLNDCLRVFKAACRVFDRKQVFGHALHIAAIFRHQQFAADGIITLSDEKIQITQDGQLFIRNVAASFDPLIQAGQTNFSKPV